MSDKQALVGIILYLVLSRIDSKEQDGKRGRKAIMKTLKKKLLQYGSTVPDKYLKMVEDSDSVMELAWKSLETDEISVNPGYMISLMFLRYPEYIYVYELKKDHVENLQDAYKKTASSMSTVKLTNKFIDQIDKYVEDMG